MHCHSVAILTSLFQSNFVWFRGCCCQQTMSHVKHEWITCRSNVLKYKKSNCLNIFIKFYYICVLWTTQNALQIILLLFWPFLRWIMIWINLIVVFMGLFTSSLCIFIHVLSILVWWRALKRGRKRNSNNRKKLCDFKRQSMKFNKSSIVFLVNTIVHPYFIHRNGTNVYKFWDT